MASGSKNVITRKIALMGYPCVGKSSITLRFVQGHFPDAYDTTIEDLHNKPYRWLGRDYNLKITGEIHYFFTRAPKCRVIFRITFVEASCSWFFSSL
ncbi:hypothetical protein COOONC_26330 [Cooperia oncophora]